MTGELVSRDQKLLGSVCRSPFMFLQTKKKRGLWEDLKLNKKTPLDTPPLELHPLSHIRLEIRGKTEVLPLRRCRVVREGVEDPVAHRNIILSIKRKYLHSCRHNGVGLEICTDHPANPPHPSILDHQREV